MPASLKQQDQEQRERVLSIDQTLREVVIPKLTSVSDTVNTIAEKQYLTRSEAKEEYAPKSDVKFIKWVVYTGLGAVITGVVGLFFLMVQRMSS